MARIWILSPVYFDVDSYRRLRGELQAVLASLPLPPLAPRFVMVDDSAGRDPSVSKVEDTVQILVPPFNLGHQRAIVHGLRRLSREIADEDFVVTLDGDGEDQPSDLPRLLATLQEQPGNLRRIALAARTRRRETPVFKLLYFFFKHFFLLLSGTVVRSGNYAAFHGWVARNVLFHPHFDLCYASSLLSLDLEIVRVPCERGERYAGQSKMTYGKLVFALLLLLGLAALAVAFVLLAAGARISAAALCGLGLFVLLCATSLGSSLLLFALFSQSQGLSMTRLRE